MQKFGYLEQFGPQTLITEDAVVNALKLVQEFGGLEQTGKLDNNTLKVCNLIIYCIVNMYLRNNIIII